MLKIITYCFVKYLLLALGKMKIFGLKRGFDKINVTFITALNKNIFLNVKLIMTWHPCIDKILPVLFSFSRAFQIYVVLGE